MGKHALKPALLQIVPLWCHTWHRYHNHRLPCTRPSEISLRFSPQDPNMWEVQHHLQQRAKNQVLPKMWRKVGGRKHRAKYAALWKSSHEFYIYLSPGSKTKTKNRICKWVIWKVCCFLRQFTSVGLQQGHTFTILLVCCPEQLPVFSWIRKEASFSQRKVNSTVKGARSWKSICFGGKIKQLQAVWSDDSAFSAVFPGILITTDMGHILDCKLEQDQIKKNQINKSPVLLQPLNNQQQETDALLHRCLEWEVRRCMPLVMSLRMSRQKAHKMVSCCCCLKSLSVRNKVGTLSSVNMSCNFIFIISYLHHK